MSIAGRLDAAIKAVCPIDGVSIGHRDDRSTWRIDFREEATAQQRAAAQAVLDAFDPDSVTPIDLSDIDNLEKSFKAMALMMRDYTNALQAGTHTQKSIAQLKTDFAAKWNSLP